MYFPKSSENPETQIYNLSAGLLSGRATTEDVERVTRFAAERGLLPLLQQELEKVQAALTGVSRV